MAKEIVSVVFAKRPTGDIVPGETFRVESRPAPTEADLKDGEVLFETYYISLDPSMRVWLRGQCPVLPGKKAPLIRYQRPLRTYLQFRLARS